MFGRGGQGAKFDAAAWPELLPKAFDKILVSSAHERFAANFVLPRKSGQIATKGASAFGLRWLLVWGTN